MLSKLYPVKFYLFFQRLSIRTTGFYDKNERFCSVNRKVRLSKTKFKENGEILHNYIILRIMR